MAKIRVLVVDDSAFVRKALARIFTAEPEMEVAGTASSGEEAVEKVLELQPDVVTLDIIMPGMDGLETLRAIMAKRPTPVLMLSQLTKQGADLTLRALELGALDFVDKSSAGMMDFLDLAQEVVSKVRTLAGSRPVCLNTEPHAAARPRPGGRHDVVAIGASTGGPLALQMVLPKFPGDIPFGLLVVQHMPRGFTGAFSKRLDTICSIEVKEAEEGDEVRPGLALVAPAGLQMTIQQTKTSNAGNRYEVRLSVDPMEALHRPSADVLFRSVADMCGRRAIGVIMTGMGSDGAAGLRSIREKGGFTIAQDEATSAIFGMPRAAIENGAADIVSPVTSIADEILRHA